MSRFFLLRLLLSPSLLSSLVCGFLALALLSLINWPYAISNPAVSQYFFGSDGLVMAIQNTQGGVGELATTVLSADFTYNVAVFLVAVLVGVIVYVILESFDHSILGIAGVWANVRDADSRSRKSIELEVAERLSVRVFCIILWGIYLFLSISVIVPFCILAARLTLDQLTLADFGYATLGFVVLFITLHIHIIFARLIALRPRIFGAEDAIIAHGQYGGGA